MKKLKKVLSILTCFVFVFLFSISISACGSKKESSKTTQNEQTNLQTESVVVKHELDEAKEIYSKAINKLFAERNYKITINRTNEEDFILNKYNMEFISYVLNNKVFWYEKIQRGDTVKEVLAGNYNDVVCEIDLTTNTYVERGSFEEVDVENQPLVELFFNVKDKVVSAETVGDKTIVSIEEIGDDVDRQDDYYNVEIVDGRIVNISAIHAEEYFYMESMYVNGWMDICITYENIDVSKIVTTLDGFTKA